MNKNRQVTFDDLEPVLLPQGNEKLVPALDSVSAKKGFSNAGMRLHERLQEQKELDIINDPYPF